MKTQKKIDLSKIRTFSVKKRKTKVVLNDFAKVSGKKVSFRQFYASLPKFLAANSLKEMVKAIIIARKNNKPVILGMGAHVIKVGLNPLIIDLLKKRVITCIALNGAGAIHDFEIATLGRTSEDVGEGLETGMFGMVKETQTDMNEAIAELQDSSSEPRGMGALLGKKLVQMKAKYRQFSLLYNAFELNLPITVHVAIGTDTIHMSPKVDARSLGEASFNDFQTLAYEVSQLEGGVYINLGSAVLLPEVFLKALTIARNLGNKVKNFTTVNMDMLQHYRPQQNVLSRPGGKAFSLTGHHEIMFPLLYQALLESL
jgi:deoxyhypusine synthase